MKWCTNSQTHLCLVRHLDDGADQTRKLSEFYGLLKLILRCASRFVAVSLGCSHGGR